MSLMSGNFTGNISIVRIAVSLNLDVSDLKLAIPDPNAVRYVKSSAIPSNREYLVLVRNTQLIHQLGWNPPARVVRE